MSDLRRQHPLLILLDTGRGLISNLSFALIIAISLPDDMFGGFIGNAIVALLAMFGLSALYNVFRWYFFQYRYEEGLVHIRQGVLFKRERTIKRDRVQSMNTNANVLQQAFGLVTLQIKTAGVSVDAEVNLRAVSKGEAESIKEHLYAKEARSENEPVEVPRASRFLQGRDIWLAALTSGRFMVLFSVVAVIYFQIFEYIPQSYLDQAVESLSTIPLMVGIGIALGLFVLTWALSAIVFVIQFANFSVRRFEDRLEISWGVLKKNHVTVKLHRLQAVMVYQGVLRQPFGLCTMLVEVAGGGAKEQERVSLLHPLIRRKEVDGFLRDILPEYHLPASGVLLPKRALRRYLFRSTVPAAVLAGIIMVSFHFWDIPYSWVSLLLLVPAVLLGLSRYRNGSISVEGDQLSLRFRDLSLVQVMMKRSHIQSLTLLANPFQRLARLRTVRSSFLSSPAGKSHSLKDLDAQDAQAVRDWYSRN
ncbi:MAG TPA: PH domain-containing protein [Methanomassiliicoccales archaeon]|nr:PH domain-containing protein [Methanomassiliicoccales archaeon]